MTLSRCFVAVLLVAIVGAFPARSQDSDAGIDKKSSVSSESPTSFLKSLVGEWEGTCKTWFQPGKLADQAKVRGKFESVLNDQFLRHTYESTMKGKPRRGENTLAFNKMRQKVQSSWMDTFHMNYGILSSEGDMSKQGFTVVGEYAVGPKQPRWKWKTVYELQDKDHLTIRCYNVLPDGREGLAVETKYERQ